MDFGPHLFLAVLEGTVTAAVLALTALGLSLVFGVMRVVNVAHGEFFMLGAVLAWWFSSLVAGSPALGFLLALVLSPLVVGAVAVLCERTVLRRVHYDPEATIVATIGLLYIVQQLALTFYGPDARPVPAPFSFRIQFPWFGYSGYKLVVIAASAALLIATWLVLTRTRLGLVPIQQAHYLMGLDPLLLSFIVVIIGGLGSILGTVVAAVIVGLSDGIVSVFFSPTLAKILATLLVALVLVVRPQGLFGEAPR
jgi:branched-chain amino acid transport system permease protein